MNHSSVQLSFHLFDGEVVDQVVVVFVQAAVQRHTVRVEEQILRKEKDKKMPKINQNLLFVLDTAAHNRLYSY